MFADSGVAQLHTQNPLLRHISAPRGFAAIPPWRTSSMGHLAGLLFVLTPLSWCPTWGKRLKWRVATFEELSLDVFLYLNGSFRTREFTVEQTCQFEWRLFSVQTHATCTFLLNAFAKYANKARKLKRKTWDGCCASTDLCASHRYIRLSFCDVNCQCNETQWGPVKWDLYHIAFH